MAASVALACQAAEVQNAGFEETYVRDANAPEVQAMVRVGWKFQSPLLWPKGWEGSAGVSNVHFAIVQEKPHSGKNCILLWGEAGSSGYLSTQVKALKKGIYRLSFQGRGRGTATLMFAGVHIVLNAQMSDNWAEYGGIYRNTADPAAPETSLTLQAQRGEAFVDDVSVGECSVLDAALVEEAATMRKEGKWLAPDAKGDAHACQKDVEEAARAIPVLRKYVEADPIPENVELIRLLEEKAAQLKNVTSAPTAEQVNEAAACARIAKRLEVELQFEDVRE